MYWNEVSKVESVKQKDKNLSFPQNRFAVLEMKIALAKILTNFEFTLDRTKTSVPIKYATDRILLSPEEQIIIKFKRI